MDTIAAISTALDQGAISIVRMSGEDAIAIADTLCTCSLHDAPSHTIHYGYIKDPQSEEVLDEVLISVFRAPKTFTMAVFTSPEKYCGFYWQMERDWRHAVNLPSALF